MHFLKKSIYVHIISYHITSIDMYLYWPLYIFSPLSDKLGPSPPFFTANLGAKRFDPVQPGGWWILLMAQKSGNNQVRVGRLSRVYPVSCRVLYIQLVVVWGFLNHQRYEIHHEPVKATWALFHCPQAWRNCSESFSLSFNSCFSFASFLGKEWTPWNWRWNTGPTMGSTETIDQRFHELGSLH